MTKTKAHTVPPTPPKRLVVVEAASTFTDDKAQGVVIVECSESRQFAKAIDELASIGTRNLALGYAASCGMADPRINGSPGHPYPINSEGLSLENVKGPNGEELSQQHPRKQPFRYRIDIPVTRRLI